MFDVELTEVMEAISKALPAVHADLLVERLAEVDQLEDRNKQLQKEWEATTVVRKRQQEELKAWEARTEIIKKREDLIIKDAMANEKRKVELDTQELAYKVAKIRVDAANDKAKSLFALVTTLFNGDPAALAHTFNVTGMIPILEGDNYKTASQKPFDVSGDVSTEKE